MKVYLMDKLAFEGTEEEANQFKDELIQKFIDVRYALDDVYFIRPKDTFEDYFNNLQVLSPVIYSFLCELKEVLGEDFIEFQFWEPNLPGISVKAHRHDGKKKTKIYTLGCLFIMILHKGKPDVFRMEP